VRLAAAERQVARQERQLARREAEAGALRQLHRLKDEFLATIAHELRTPLTVLSGYAQWLQQWAAARAEPVVGQRVEHMVTAAAELSRLVDDLLDFARWQRGDLTVQAEPVDLAPVLRQVVAGLRQPAGRERLVVDLPSRVPAYADPARVAQAAGNLLENALRYAPSGPIVLRVATAPADAGMVRVEVKDRGPGVPAREQERIWEKFYRGHGVAGLNVARGSGIGLAVVKALVEAQGGRVGLASTPGSGACFWLDLPAAHAGGAKNGTNGRLTADQPDRQPAPSAAAPHGPRGRAETADQR
jgi:signal transduction histidine kinase